MMHRTRDQYKRLTDSVRSVVYWLTGIERGCVSGGWTPGIPFTINHGETWVGEGEAAVFVDGGHIGWSGDVEGVLAEEGLVG